MVELSNVFGGIKIKNPLVIGSGPLSGTAEGIKKCIDAGYGAVSTKTASMFDYYHKFPYPDYKLIDYNKFNSKDYRDWSWFHNDHNSPVGPMEFAEIISEVSYYAKARNCILIGSYAASSLDDWVVCGKEYERSGADMLELNFCSPGPSLLSDVVKPGDASVRYGDILSNDVSAACEIVRKIYNKVNIPVICKLSPKARINSKEFCSELYKAGAAGIEFYANSKGMRIDIEKASPIGSGTGSLNTHGHLSETIFDVAQLAKEYPYIDVIAGRGVRRWQDAVELIMAGAALVEICTSALVYGLSFGQEILNEMALFMKMKGYNGIDKMRGIALGKVLKPSEIKDVVVPVYSIVDETRCNTCGRCYDVCAYLAIKINNIAKINKSRCVGCSLCNQVCPNNSIYEQERTVEEYLSALYSLHPEAIYIEDKY